MVSASRATVKTRRLGSMTYSLLNRLVLSGLVGAVSLSMALQVSSSTSLSSSPSSESAPSATTTSPFRLHPDGSANLASRLVMRWRNDVVWVESVSRGRYWLYRERYRRQMGRRTYVRTRKSRREMTAGRMSVWCRNCQQEVHDSWG